MSSDTKKFHDNERTHILHNLWTSTHRGGIFPPSPPLAAPLYLVTLIYSCIIFSEHGSASSLRDFVLSLVLVCFRIMYTVALYLFLSVQLLSLFALLMDNSTFRKHAPISRNVVCSLVFCVLVPDACKYTTGLTLSVIFTGCRSC